MVPLLHSQKRLPYNSTYQPNFKSHIKTQTPLIRQHTPASQLTINGLNLHIIPTGSVILSNLIDQLYFETYYLQVFDLSLKNRNRKLYHLLLCEYGMNSSSFSEALISL